MPEYMTLYARSRSPITAAQMKAFNSGSQFCANYDSDGDYYVYRWPDVTVQFCDMPQGQLPEHLRGFCAWVDRVCAGKPGEREQAIKELLQQTSSVLGVVIEPERDRDKRAEELLTAVCYFLKPLVFCNDGLFDTVGTLLLASDGSYDEAFNAFDTSPLDSANDILPIDDFLPYAEQSEPSVAQRARFENARSVIERYQVPTLSAPIYVEDDETVILRDARRVAQRALVLGAVTFLADGGSREDALEMMDVLGLWSEATREETSFLQGAKVDPEMARRMAWRLEGLWVLMWALGDVEELAWPSEFCDVPALIDRLFAYQADPDLLDKVYLRGVSEILDESQLSLLIHWALREASLNGDEVPSDLDWSGRAERVSAAQCVGLGVIQERQHALNWLTCFAGADWEDVDTPT